MQKEDVQGIQTSHTANSQEQHVEELAGSDDYWLTLTDAARATRRQDVSIRRWISKGLLPVKRQHVGLNQRTRLVRASDLAALTPIIDPAGAISTERGRLDLTSIPTQQAQIKADQQQILAQLEKTFDYVNKETATLHEMLSEQHAALVSVQQTAEQHITQLREITEQQRREIITSLDQQHSAMQLAIQHLHIQIEAVHSELSQQLYTMRDQTIVLATTLEETTGQQQILIESSLAQIQDEALKREHLAQQVETLFAQLTKQQARIEAEATIREQLRSQLLQVSHQVVAHDSRLESNAETLLQIQQQFMQLQSQFTEQYTEHQHEHRQLSATMAQRTHSQQQWHTELCAQLASLTHEVQQHKALPHDYVKFTERIAALERDILEVKQALPQNRLEAE